MKRAAMLPLPAVAASHSEAAVKSFACCVVHRIHRHMDPSLAQSSSSSWFHQPVFSSFWRHYQHQTDWMRSRGVTPVPVCLPNDGTQTQPRTEGSADDASDECDETDDTDNTNDYEVMDEYLEFIAVTRKHQKEYEKLKAYRRRQERSIVYTDITTLSGPVTAVQPQDTGRNISGNAKLMRNMQLTQWYGEPAGQEIGAIEDRMDKNFDEYIAKHKPPYFPACPIAMTGYFDNN